MCEVRKKVDWAISVLPQLVGGENEISSTMSNVKLMKLFYLFCIEYCGITNGEDEFIYTFSFTAMDKGPVEETIYSNITYIRNQIANHLSPNSDILKNPDIQKAIHNLRKFAQWTTEQLVDFTHNVLAEWAKTPLYSKMKLEKSDYMNEFHILQKYLETESMQLKYL